MERISTETREFYDFINNCDEDSIVPLRNVHSPLQSLQLAKALLPRMYIEYLHLHNDKRIYIHLSSEIPWVSNVHTWMPGKSEKSR